VQKWRNMIDESEVIRKRSQELREELKQQELRRHTLLSLLPTY